MLAEIWAVHVFPSSYKKKLKGNCYVSSFPLKLDTTTQLVNNIKMINLFFIVTIVSSKMNMYINT